MRILFFLIVFAATVSPNRAFGQPQPGQPLREACSSLPVNDACALIAEASRMLEPSYASNKEVDGVAAFRALGYDATYFRAGGGLFGSTTDLFLVSRPLSNRLFVVITGTESPRDWYENAKFGSYVPVYRDGQFYIPPGHAGFRRGMLNIINEGVLAINEFDDRPLDCASLGSHASGLSRHLCEHRVGNGQDPVETILVGHSRGAGIGILLATAFAGLEIQRPQPQGAATVAPQAHWPLSLHAVIGFAPPYAVYDAPDPRTPQGMPDQWTVLTNHGIIDRTIWFINERDIVPLLSLGQGRHFGHRFRIQGNGRVSYDGTDWGPVTGFAGAHGSAGYCSDILIELGENGNCRRPR